jgi:hypothetical protein
MIYVLNSTVRDNLHSQRENRTVNEHKDRNKQTNKKNINQLILFKFKHKF